ncbi:MAG: hypothetical protein Q7R39_11445 [Dehalococcoidia bacterium]|nr:hypothetical protein [Dehalococcoidia bacterium]
MGETRLSASGFLLVLKPVGVISGLAGDHAITTAHEADGRCSTGRGS